MSFDLNSHRAQLVVAAIAGSAATFGLLTAYNQYTRQKKRHELGQEVLRSLASESKPPLETSVSQPRVQPVPNGGFEYDEELIREQLARNYAFFGEEGMSKIRKGTVVVVGCGGVGSWAAVMLARSGVANIRLVDFDYVTLSSLNRHATALLSDVGTPKVNCIERTLRQISRWVKVDARIELWRKDDGGALLEGADWVIDAIDNITTKVDLLKYCHDNGIKVFSSMGAGAKNDPTRIQISDISYTMYDPLARSVRQRLRRLGIPGGIPVVYSTEVPGEVKLLPLAEEEFEKGNVKELGVFDDFRVRILPVLGPLPSIFGLHIATYIICDLAGKPISNPLAIKGRKKLYERLYKDLLSREQKYTGQSINRLPIDEDDVGMLFEDIHRGRSVIPPHAVPTRPVLARWDPNLPLGIDNCVAMEFDDAEKHMKQCFVSTSDVPAKTAEELWGKEVVDIVQRRVEEVRRQREWIL